MCGIARTKFIKGNDSNKTMDQIKKNYQGENKFLNNSLSRRYGRYFYVFKEISNSKIKFFEKNLLHLIHILFHFPIIRFFFKKPYIYYYKKN